MRRSGYNSLNNSQEVEDGGDIVDGQAADVEEAKPFTEPFGETKLYKRTLCLVFILCFGGFVSIQCDSLDCRLKMLIYFR